MEDRKKIDFKDQMRAGAQGGVQQIKDFLSIKKADKLYIKAAKLLAQIFLIAFTILISPLLILLIFFITAAPG